ncbi:hypothetical protein MN202_00785 [Rheinheimera muenzenbergensis]|uniref:Phage protein n=1 Tax=Rheinheimera muenzenbergensis TaxID=1193628 RepID=A0ABU8C1H3_9GAMM
MSWQYNNIAHRHLATFVVVKNLQTIHKNGLKPSFDDVGKWTLQYVIPLPAGAGQRVIEQNASSFCHELISWMWSIKGATFEQGLDYDKAMEALMSEFSKPANTVADCGDVMDAVFRCIGEI